MNSLFCKDSQNSHYLLNLILNSSKLCVLLAIMQQHKKKFNFILIDFSSNISHVSKFAKKNFCELCSGHFQLSYFNTSQYRWWMGNTTDLIMWNCILLFLLRVKISHIGNWNRSAAPNKMFMVFMIPSHYFIRHLLSDDL